MGSIENVGLKDNDVIRIPAYNQRVTLEGQVKRPGIFEMKPGESFLIYYHLLQVSMSLPIQHQ
jgi:protein involved in polysaccharide export with SLBB domain